MDEKIVDYSEIKRELGRNRLWLQLIKDDFFSFHRDGNVAYLQTVDVYYSLPQISNVIYYIIEH